jgi:hypothetical protein
VAFLVYFNGTFVFGGSSYTGGDLAGTGSRSGFIGTLSATGADGWIRSLGFVEPRQLVTGPGGTLTASGAASLSFDLGGGMLGFEHMSGLPAFVVRYSSAGSHLWSRTFDPDLSLHFLAQQPDGVVVRGGTMDGPVEPATPPITTREEGGE